LVPYSRVKKGETVAWERVEWIDVALDKDTWWPVLDTAINYLIAHNAGNFWTGWGTTSFSRRLVPWG